MVEPALSSCEVRRDDDGVAAGEGPDGRADADGAEAGAEQVRPVLRAHEPFVDDRARGAVDAAAPREVLADDSRLDAVPVHAAREGTMAEVATADHVRRVRPGGGVQPLHD